ncbi:phosphatidate cytidylyltransferase [Desulfomicrobium orale]|uniref:Phosphatidate cytidylyltransferase n=1 Tax=Desulfomicrobium orale DSM 12838 TaxID=888061 RepID=A0A0X8JRD9_9BACT|nr:phosphatidate cytidylyltransferase [Desulfomicrobium orale]AMD93599.1 hypothetical protein AXF15_11130 [Desulfomicrobium orale DSM 12838]
MSHSHFQRILTALVLLPFLGIALFYGDPALSTGVTIVAVLGLLEFYAMFWPGRSRAGWKIYGVAMAAGIVWAPLAWPGTVLVCLTMLGAALAFLLAHDRGRSPSAFQDSQIFLFGLLYLPFLLRLLRNMSFMEIMLVLLVTFAADTGAYYAGSHFGGPKIWPSISPKKTWSGSLGGLLSSVIVAVGFGLAAGASPWAHFAFLGAAMNIAAQTGDFFESALKRSRDVKDSGRILPGHGGMLDRIDSLLFALPLYCALAAVHPFFPATL